MKKYKAKILTAVFTMVAVAVCALIAVSPSVMADGEAYDESYLLRKALMNDIYTCYNGGHVRATVVLSDFNTLGGIALDNTDGVAKLPNGFTDIADNDLSCQQLFGGYSGSGGTFAGVASYSSNNFQGVSSTSSSAEKTNALTALGYEADNSSAEQSQCAYITYTVSQTDENGTYQGATTFRTNQVCAYVDSNGNVTSSSGGSTLYLDDSGSNTVDGSKPVSFTVYAGGDTIALHQDNRDDEEIYCYEGAAFSECVSSITSKRSGSFMILSSQNWQTTFTAGETSTRSVASAVTQYTMPTAKPDVAVDSIFGDHSQRYLSVPETVSLYQIYLNKYADVQCSTTDSTATQALANAGYVGPFKAISNGAYVEGCYAKETGSTGTYNGYVSSTWGTEVSLSDMIDFINNNTVADGLIGNVVSANIKDASSGEVVNPDNAGNTTSETCYSSASALGWILCPIIESTANAVEGLYESVIKPFLSIQASTFDTGSGVYQAWQIFQSFANIIFVIVFLVTIFSQLTGIGIDNLGIKRILPKLITVAILVNLSYIICQALVDVSNIIGYGANHLFDNIQISSSNTVSTGQSAVTSLLSLLGLGGGAAIAVATASIWAPAMILPILLTLISLLIGLVFAFVLLGARQAGVIILVFISPIAFVLYMLPNTKPIFDKWKKAFMGLLLLYPICGLLMGGAKFTGEVLTQTSNSFWVAAIGSLLSVIVFFFIPTLVRSSMTAMGNVGARITGFSQNLGRGAQNAARAGVQQSGAFKNLQERAQLRQSDRERGRLERVVSRINRTPESVRSDAQRKQLAMAQSQLNRMTQEDAETTVGVKPLDFEQAKTAATSRRFNTEVDAIGTQLVNDGTAGKTGDLDPESFNNGDAFETGSLASYIMNASTTEQRYAAVKALMSSGHHGETAVHQVMQRLAADGKFAELSQVARAVKTDRNFGGLKGAARSTYDFVNALENGDLRLEGDKVMMSDKNGNSVEATPNNFISKVNFSNMSEESLVSANKEELQRYLSALNSGELSQDKIDRLQSLSRSALTNERLASRRKGAVEDTLRKIVNANATAAPSANPSQPNANPDQTFNVQGGANNGGQNNNQTNNNQTP